MATQTLVTKVTVRHPRGVTNRNDVPTLVGYTHRGTYITFGASIGKAQVEPEQSVTVTLSEGERIAFIEALGGIAAPYGTNTARFYDADGSMVGAVKL